jgi:hypothetical protein
MDWDPDFLERTPLFEPLRPNAPAFGPGWPSLADWQQAFDARRPPVRNRRGARLRPVPPGRKAAALEEMYEARIHLAGELPLRPRDWHDCFNALVWLAFPLAKAALSARHYDALREQRAAGRPNRVPVQDALTLFDESGVVAAYCDEDLARKMRAFCWKELFWTHRDRLPGGMRFALFGHALCEKALQPFLGITGRAILLKVPPELVAAPVEALLPVLDSRIAEHIADPRRLLATRDLEVLPILGVPGWCADNEREAFYDNVDYFRPGRRSPDQRES